MPLNWPSLHRMSRGLFSRQASINDLGFDLLFPRIWCRSPTVQNIRNNLAFGSFRSNLTRVSLVVSLGYFITSLSTLENLPFSYQSDFGPCEKLKGRRNRRNYETRYRCWLSQSPFSVFLGEEKNLGENDFSRLLSAIFPDCILVGGVLVF